ncbi:MAG TPA: class I SAM-dependent methyltransferase [bacterium]|nr:class I SAM-dependent methyltransferase [bacterium]
MIDRTLLHYNQEAENISSRYENADMSWLYEIITRTFPAESRLLELGCGSGRDAGILLRSGLDIVATDGSPAMLEQAAALHPELKDRLRQYELPGQSGFSASSFDGILAIAVLMHLATGGIKDTLKEVFRLLKPGGRFFFSVPEKRPDLDDRGFDGRGRRFTMLSSQEWEELSCTVGLVKLSVVRNDDSLGREQVAWLSFLFQKPEE